MLIFPDRFLGTFPTDMKRNKSGDQTATKIGGSKAKTSEVSILPRTLLGCTQTGWYSAKERVSAF